MTPSGQNGSGAEAGRAAAARTGLWCLVAIARLNDIDLSEEQLEHGHALAGQDLPPQRLARLAEGHGLRARPLRADWGDLQALGEAIPVVLRLWDGSYVVLSGLREDRGVPEVVIRNPLAPQGGFDFWDRATLERLWTGDLLLLKRRFGWRDGFGWLGTARGTADGRRPFGLGWFVPEVLRQRRAFADVALCVLMLHLLGLALPVFFQIVIDKVVTHQATGTLVTLSVGVGGAILFEALLTWLRSLILTHSTAKIDIRTTTTVFHHLLSLPVSYFERIPAGVLVNHVQQDRNIRDFLTGRLFGGLLDATALLIFIPVLFVYSVPLGALVVGFALLTATMVGLLVPLFRRRLEALYRAEADRQALLVETIHGIGTIKALALEPTQRRLWDSRSADTVERHIGVGLLAGGTRAVSGLLDKLSTVLLIALGVGFVFDGSLSVGALVAVQMLAGRVSGPLMQLVGLVNDYQQVAVSARMLGEVMNAPPENGLNRGLQPRLRGRIEFDAVSFRYPDGNRAALERVSFTLEPEMVLGVVGRSGSGKSTLVRLLQGLHGPTDGVIRLDGHDLRDIDPIHLRRSTGVVLQDSVLFNGSVRDNIARSRPGARFEEIVHAAHLAGADEFIQRLPNGYETVVREGAVNLSGGQKQRLAIARALLRQPPLLILDEATSALDPESETILQRNLAAITRGRTTVIVSHRLASIRRADAILVLDDGRIVGFAPHDRLLGECALYRQLWNLQTEHTR